MAPFPQKDRQAAGDARANDKAIIPNSGLKRVGTQGPKTGVARLRPPTYKKIKNIKNVKNENR